MQYIHVELQGMYLPKKIYSVVLAGRYLNEMLAFRILSEDCYETEATLTVNIYPEHRQNLVDVPRFNDSQVWFKTWSENSGIIESMIEQELLHEPIFKFPVNQFGSMAWLCPLNKLSQLVPDVQRMNGSSLH